MKKSTLRSIGCLFAASLLWGACSDMSDLASQQNGLRTTDLSGYRIVVNASLGGDSRVVPETGAWQDGDKLFIALDGDDANAYQLTYSATDNNFVIDAVSAQSAGFAASGTVSGLYTTKPNLGLKEGKVQGATLGDVVYTKTGSYTKADKTLTINLKLNERKTALVKLTGLESEAYVSNMKATYTQLTSLKDLTWAADDTTPSYVYDAASKTSYCYGTLPEDGKIRVTYLKGGSYVHNETLPTLAAGEMTTVKSPDEAANEWTRDAGLADLTLWTSDAAWSKTFNEAGFTISKVTRQPAEGSDWLSVTSDGTTVKVSATANTTGAPRQAAITFTDGSKSATVNVTQIEDKDLAGTWDMTAFKVFTGKGDASCGKHDTKWSVTSTTPPTDIGEMKLHEGKNYGNSREVNIELHQGVTATACDGLINKSKAAQHTNNLLLKGLYENLTSQAWSHIDYDQQQGTVGLFFDLRGTTKAQRLYTGTFAGQYATFFPELRNKNTSAWTFNFATIGGAQMFWYMGKLSVTGHTTTLKWEANKDVHQNLSTSTNYDIWGVQVFRYTGTKFAYNTLIRQGATTNTNSAYAVTYQGDMQMRRTAEGYKEITIGGDN